MVRVNYRNRCEICSKLTIKTPERRHWRRPGAFLLTLNIFHTFFSASVVGFEQVNASRVLYPEEYSEPRQISKVKDKKSIIHLWQGSEYAFSVYLNGQKWTQFILVGNFAGKRILQFDWPKNSRPFPVNIANFLRTSILKNICEWLLL